MTKLKVAVVEPIGGHGGNEFYDFGLCEAVARRHNVFLFTCDKTVLDEEVAFRTEVVKCFRGIYGNSPRLIRGLRYVKGILSACFFCLRKNIDIVHVHFYNFSILEKITVMLFKVFGFKVIATVHDIEPFDRYGEEVSIDYSGFFNLVDAIIVHTDFSVKCLSSILDEKNVSKIMKVKSGDMDFVYNKSIDKNEARKRLNIPIDKKIILFFGHIKKVKGLDLLLAAFNMVADKIPGTLLYVVGRPWKIDEKEYFSMVREDLRKRVVFQFDYIPNEQVYLYFKASDLVVLPYRKIYNSSLVLRAFDYGSCVLASDLETFKEFVIPGETGFLFERENVGDLAEKIVYLCNSPDMIKKLALNSKLFVENNFSQMEILSGMESVYGYVLNDFPQKVELGVQQKKKQS